MADLEHFKRDDFEYDLFFEDNEGNAIDITGGTIWFSIKKADTDSDASALVKEKITAHTDPTEGKSHIHITKDRMNVDPGTWNFDFQFMDSAGKVTTLKKGKIKIVQDVTHELGEIATSTTTT